MNGRYMTESEILYFKSCMVRKGFNISSLAKSVGMTRESLSARINGKIDFGRTEMETIANAFEMNPQEIFFANKVS